MVDDDRNGRSSTTQMDEKIAGVAALSKEDLRITFSLPAKRFNIPKPIVHRIFKEDLLKRNICYRHVPHTATSEQCEEALRHVRNPSFR